MDRLARTNDKDENRRQKIIIFAEEFLRYAFREKLTEEELEKYVRSSFPTTSPLHTSVEKIVLTALKSPRFLYPEWQALAKKKRILKWLPPGLPSISGTPSLAKECTA